ncbi:MAG: PAS domain-containing protein [Candidatus Omnitrophica bacterium]|nr:PAS domain-containing protein [Candidatus Omnitrophota bacterium]
MLRQVFLISNYSFNPHAIPFFLVSLSVLGFGLKVVLAKVEVAFKSRLHLSLFLYALAVSWWLFIQGITLCIVNGVIESFWGRACYAGIVFLPATIYYSTFAFLKVPTNRRFLWFVMAMTAFFFLILPTDLFISGAVRIKWGYAARAGQLHPAFVVFLIFVTLVALRQYFLKFKDKNIPAEEKRLIRSMLIAVWIGYLAALDFLTNYGISYYPSSFIFIGIYTIFLITHYEIYRIDPAVAADTVINTMLDALVVFNPEGRIILVNPAAKRLLKCENVELIGRPIESIFLEKDLFSREGLNRLIKDCKYENGEMNCLSSDGQAVPVSFTASVLRNKTGRLLGAVGIIRDMRSIKKFIKDLEDKSNYLRLINIELGETNKKLQDAQLQLAQSSKMASLGLLAGGVAHEINNPLTGVLNNVQLVRMFAQQKTEFKFEEFKDILEVVEKSAERCKKITQALLEFSHASNGVFTAVSLNHAINQVITLIEYELRLRNIKIVKELQEGLPAVLGDVQLLQQVVFDIINNAIWAIQKKHNREGGEISIKTEYLADKESVVLYIRDNGMGIAKDNLSKIFEPYFTTKKIGEGTGLGLSIVYKIIKSHQGKIEVDSIEGEGTSFKIELPVGQKTP